MKKYLAILAVLFTVILSSCSNDDIPVEYNSTIRINPATVMSNFTYQENPGDLDGVSAGNELRIRLYIFDESGKLVQSFQQMVPNYLTTASFDADIPNGRQYQFVALTDVVRKSDGDEYWVVSEESSISTMKITYDGTSNTYGAQEILGLKSVWVKAGENPTINVEAAGALVCTVLSNLHAYANVGSILIFSDRANGYYDFSSGGTLESNPILDDNASFISLSDIPNYRYQVSYSYKFMMPQKNMRIYYGISDTNGEIAGVSAADGVELEMGKEYKCYLTLDPDNDGSGNYAYGINPIASGRSSDVQVPVSSKESVHTNDCENQYSVKDLIKIQSAQ